MVFSAKMQSVSSKSLFLVLLTIFSNSSRASDARPFATELVEVSAMLVGSLYGSVYLHEQAHAYAVRAAGGKVQKISVSLLSGRTEYVGDFSDDQFQSIVLAGYVANRLAALGAKFYLDHAEKKSWLTRFATIFNFVNRAAIAEGWVVGLFGKSDFRDSVDAFTTHKSERDWLYGAYGALIALDIWYSWSQTKFKSEKPIECLAFNLVPIRGGALTQLKYNF